MPDPASITLNLATMPDGWYWVKTQQNTERDFWSPAYLCHNDKPDRTLTYWLDSWLDSGVEPTEIGPRILAPDETALAQPTRAQAGVAELVAKWRAEIVELDASAAKYQNSDMPISATTILVQMNTLKACANTLAALGGEDG